MKGIEKLSREILLHIENGEITGKKQLNAAKAMLCKEFGLEKIPTNPDILAFAGQPSRRVKQLLKAKPVRSKSGITVVAVMAAPGDCPGECIYCPSSLLDGVETPKSYTGKEPATMRALSQEFSPKKQAANRLQQLKEAGHATNKVELIVMGGTFLAKPTPYQREFMIKCINAVAGSRAKTLTSAKKAAETSKRRITGITFETRPDYCAEKHVNRMLEFGGTRCELGVQAPSDAVYDRIQRGHCVQDVVKATALLKDSAFKVCYHYMPGLPGIDAEQDLRLFKGLFSRPEFKPDMLKIYPTLVIRETKLYELWKKGEYTALDSGRAAKLVAEMKALVPRWSRIMRVQRDIPSQLIEAGVKKSNLRQLALQELENSGGKCKCIRCREAGLKEELLGAEPKLFSEKYNASNGKEFFISFEDKCRETLFAFLRMRLPYAPFREEIDENAALVRELRVLGEALQFGERVNGEPQHSGLGRKLLKKSEEIAGKEGMEKILVLSGLGVKEYYRKLGFKDDGAYVSKTLNS